MEAAKKPRAEYLRQLHMTLAQPGACQVFAEQLRQMGYARRLEASERDVALYNQAERMLADLYDASPEKAKRVAILARGWE